MCNYCCIFALYTVFSSPLDYHIFADKASVIFYFFHIFYLFLLIISFYEQFAHFSFLFSCFLLIFSHLFAHSICHKQNSTMQPNRKTRSRQKHPAPRKRTLSLSILFIRHLKHAIDVLQRFTHQVISAVMTDKPRGNKRTVMPAGLCLLCRQVAL